ncbi:MAG TPA: alpha-L-arabinofuranosidase C-terminal domain-containing protein [Opitutales bacterium]|nr:alpha-L-arabinofuranosidase C-terminal domain-containing protein [Opitutales bacterium]
MKSPALFKFLPHTASILALLSLATPVRGADAPASDAAPVATITIDAGQVKGHSSPILFGIMTEDINYCLDGGLYAQLIANSTFQEPANSPQRWSIVQDTGASGTMEFDHSVTLNEQHPVSLKLTATTASHKLRVGFSNEGYWGISVRPNTTYHVSFYAKADGNFTGPLAVAISSTKEAVTYAYATVPKLTSTWQKYEITLNTDATVKPTKDANFLIWTTAPGTAYFSMVSLFPPTYNNRPNGLRPDLMQLLADYHPAFLRFPGGNFLEGNTLATRFDWKKTIGDLSLRPGHLNDAWRYYSDDGLGLLEYLTWCEDLKMQPVLAVYAGLALGGGGEVAAGPELAPYVQDAMDEIEYVTGDVNTKWGAERAKDGHPAPFKLNYVEIGNEDWRGNYDGRFSQFYDAIKAKYPNLQLIDASTRGSVNGNGRLTSRIATTNTAHQPDVMDSHLYTSTEAASDVASTTYDKYDRTGPKVFEGEWATRVGAPTPNFTGALGDAAYMTGLERNSDIVIMASYAPLFVNVSNPGGRGTPGSSMQWPSDLIGYDALNSYGSPAYYAQVMFNNNRGDEILGLDATNIPTRAGPPAARGAAAAAPQTPAMFFSSTRDSKTGIIYVKAVNPTDTATPLHIEIKGANSIAPNGESIVMKADSLTDTNSLAEPTKIVPVTSKESGFGSSFTRTLPPYSITILKLQSK